MKQITMLIAIILMAVSQGYAQPDKSRFEKIKKIKAEFITEKIHLKQEQETAFWNVYNEYEKELRAARKSYFQQYKEKRGNMDEATARRYVDDNLEYQEEELKLKKKYKTELLKVISAQQLADLYHAEREFKKMLVNELRERRSGKEHQK